MFNIEKRAELKMRIANGMDGIRAIPKQQSVQKQPCFIREQGNLQSRKGVQHALSVK